MKTKDYTRVDLSKTQHAPNVEKTVKINTETIWLHILTGLAIVGVVVSAIWAIALLLDFWTNEIGLFLRQVLG